MRVMAGLITDTRIIIIFTTNLHWHRLHHHWLEPPGRRDNRYRTKLGFAGEYKIILQLIGILSHGKQAKRLADASIDRMDGVQNLRRAVFECVHSLLRFSV
jgi:hypothetical protein